MQKNGEETGILLIKQLYKVCVCRLVWEIDADTECKTNRNE